MLISKFIYITSLFISFNMLFSYQGTKADGALTKLFAGKMKSYIKCINVDYESSRVENYYGNNKVFIPILYIIKGCLR